MKKIVSLFFVCVFILSLCGCSQNANSLDFSNELNINKNIGQISFKIPQIDSEEKINEKGNKFTLENNDSLYVQYNELSDDVSNFSENQTYEYINTMNNESRKMAVDEFTIYSSKNLCVNGIFGVLTNYESKSNLSHNYIYEYDFISNNNFYRFSYVSNENLAEKNIVLFENIVKTINDI